VVTSAQRDSELIANLAAECQQLHKAQMVGIRGTQAANQACLLGDRFHMLPVANSAGHRQCQDRFVDGCAISPSAAPSQRFGLLRDCRLVWQKGREL